MCRSLLNQSTPEQEYDRYKPERLVKERSGDNKKSLEQFGTVKKKITDKNIPPPV